MAWLPEAEYLYWCDICTAKYADGEKPVRMASRRRETLDPLMAVGLSALTIGIRTTAPKSTPSSTASEGMRNARLERVASSLRNRLLRRGDWTLKP